MKKKLIENTIFVLIGGGILMAYLYLMWVMATSLLIKVGWLNITPPNQELMEVPMVLAGVAMSLLGLLLAFISDSGNPLKRKRRS